MDVKADELVLTDDKLTDIKKIKPIVFAPEGLGYYGIDKILGKTFSIGKRK